MLLLSAHTLRSRDVYPVHQPTVSSRLAGSVLSVQCSAGESKSSVRSDDGTSQTADRSSSLVREERAD